MKFACVSATRSTLIGQEFLLAQIGLFTQNVGLALGARDEDCTHAITKYIDGRAAHIEEPVKDQNDREGFEWNRLAAGKIIVHRL